MVLSTALNTSTAYTYVPTILRRVESGPGCISKLPAVLKALSITKPMIITGQSLATKTNVIKRIIDALEADSTAKCVGVHSDIKAHAPKEDIMTGLEILKKNGGDGLITIGGGSPIDAGKAIINFMEKENGQLLKMVSIPTTLSAAEYTILAGWTENGKKTGAKGSNYTSSAIIYDAELALHTPNKLWLATGIRAVDHAVEQQIRPGASVPVRAMAREAAAILFESLRACAKDEKDVEARQRAFVGASMSLWSDDLIGPLGLSHALGYNLGSPYGIPHGTCSCLTLGPTIAALAKHIDGPPLAQLASILPFVDPNASAKLASSNASEKEKALAVASAIDQLVKDVGVSATLTEYKVPKEDVDGIAERALKGVGREEDQGLKKDVVEALNKLF